MYSAGEADFLLKPRGAVDQRLWIVEKQRNAEHLKILSLLAPGGRLSPVLRLSPPIR